MLQFKQSVGLFSCALGLSLGSCKTNSANNSLSSDVSSTKEFACREIDSIRSFSKCLDRVGGRVSPEISEVLSAMPSGKLRCTTSDRSAQPGSPTNPRCFLEISGSTNNLIVLSWTLDGDHIEVGQTIPNMSTGGRAGQIMADFAFGGEPVPLEIAFQRARVGGFKDSDPCTHCHRPFRNVNGDLRLGEYQVQDTIQPGSAILDPVEKQPVVTTIRIDGDAAENIESSEIPPTELFDYMKRLGKDCPSPETSERCRRLGFMKDILARSR